MGFATKVYTYAKQHEKCRERENCSGPGCARKTGKTERKANYLRPHPNKRGK